jgi:hypothetical protein
MIDKIATVIIFIVSFVMVTALIAFMNLQYNNIFDFDFTPTHQAVAIETEEQIEELKAELRPEIKQHVFDSLKVVGFDSTAIVNTNNRVVLLEDSIAVLQKNIKKLSRETTTLEATNAKNEDKKDAENEPSARLTLQVAGLNLR